jgi:hypothetical protein
LQTEAGSFADPVEGLQDIQRLNVMGETHAVVAAREQRLAVRVNVLHRAIEVLRELLDDGWPALPPAPIPDVILNDIAEQRRTIAAAEAQFTAVERAATFAFTVQPTENK